MDRSIVDNGEFGGVRAVLARARTRHFLLAALLIVALSGYALFALNGYASQRRQEALLLSRIQAQANLQDSLQWQAVVDGALTPTRASQIAVARGAMSDALAELAQTSGEARIAKVRRAFDPYIAAVDHELRLVGEGRIDEALITDREEVTPRFADLRDALEDESLVFGEQARNAEITAEVGSLLVLLVAAAVATGLHLRVENARVRASVMDAEQRTLRASEAHTRSLVQNAFDMITLLDDDGVIRYISPSAERTLGREPRQIVGSKLHALLHHDDVESVNGLLRAIQPRPGAHAVIDCRWSHQDGTYRHTETAVTNLLADESVRGLVLNVRDVSERKALEEELKRQALQDPLTNLANRALFKDRLEHALAHRQRGSIAVLFLDLDGFKPVNDSLGHAAGDQLLRAVAGRLVAAMRLSDTVARLGGDEFACLLEDGAGENEAVVVAERILESVCRPFALGGREVTIGASVGIVTSALDPASGDELLRDADVAMYVAKSRGRGRYVVFDPSMRTTVLSRFDLREELGRAIERDEFVLHYQPIVALDTGRIDGVEALLRWRHPTRGLLAPGEFIAVAEETGLIVSVGRWVLRQACLQAQFWLERHPRSRLTLSVNLSARQLHDSALASEVGALLRETGLEPGRLVLEITESVVMQDAEATRRTLEQLKALGVRLAIDDFGTGYSSLSYLRRFPVDFIKIDRSFVSGMASGEQGSAIVAGIVELARTMNLQTVAEGIELGEQVDRLRELRCDFGQGYYFARPQEWEMVHSLLLADELAMAGSPAVAAIGERS